MSTDNQALEFCPDHEEGAPELSIGTVRNLVVGINQQVPLADGRQVQYVNLDNAATTPPLRPVLDCSRRFYEWYSSVHRGTGFKSLLSTHVYEKCRNVVAGFVGADPSHHTVVFTQNATHALNKLAGRLCLREGGVVLTTLMEHHSNLLPWRRPGRRVDYVPVVPADGTLDLAALEDKMQQHAGRLCLVTVTGASNVTGIVPPIRKIARLAHECGSFFAVDATQLVAHRPFQMGAPDDPERVDFAVFSGHKVYAPFGSGVLIGPTCFFEQGSPETVGGGTVEVVTLDEVAWAAPPEKEEAGTPNVPGAIALASALRVIQAIGMDDIIEHERELRRRAVEKLRRLRGITLYGNGNAGRPDDRIGIISLNADRYNHAQLAAILGYEWGIGVRNGCFCAQPYVRSLLGVSDDEMKGVVKKLLAGDHATAPGMVRLSFGIYNTAEEVDYFCEAMSRILLDGPRVKYVIDPAYHDYVPENNAFRLHEYAPF